MWVFGIQQRWALLEYCLVIRSSITHSHHHYHYDHHQWHHHLVIRSSITVKEIISTPTPASWEITKIVTTPTNRLTIALFSFLCLQFFMLNFGSPSQYLYFDILWAAAPLSLRQRCFPPKSHFAAIHALTIIGMKLDHKWLIFPILTTIIQMVTKNTTVMINISKVTELTMELFFI